MNLTVGFICQGGEEELASPLLEVKNPSMMQSQISLAPKEKASIFIAIKNGKPQYNAVS
jgi:hypothetical protein